VVVSVADEEVASVGTIDLLQRLRTDGAIVTEPTELEVCTAHKGFLWLRVTVLGRAAHGSRYDEGVDANIRMGRVLARLDQLERSLRLRPPHPLLGTPSLHAAVIHGGSGASTYAARCVLDIERRTLPDERDEDVVAEIQEMLDEEAAADPAFHGEVVITLSRPGFQTSPRAPLATAIRAAASRFGGEGLPVGKWYWMDASLIAAAGIETVVYGPAGTGAHSDIEWVDLASVDQTAAVLADTALSYCGAA
jgi:acetylornithine deacetylase